MEGPTLKKRWSLREICFKPCSLRALCLKGQSTPGNTCNNKYHPDLEVGNFHMHICFSDSMTAWPEDSNFGSGPLYINARDLYR